MGTYIDSDTDFSNVVIINSNRIVVGGAWTAKLVNGTTMYTNSATGESYAGPINFVGITSLTISSGAVADNIVVIKSATQTSAPSITVSEGGTLSNSTVFTSKVYISYGATSEENSYVSSDVSLRSGTINVQGNVTTTGGTSTNDSFYIPSTTSTSSGTLISLGNSTASFQTSDGTGKTSVGIASSMNNPNIYGNGVSTSTNSISLSKGSYIGDNSIATNQPVQKYTTINGYTVKNSNKVGTTVASTWTAQLVDGKTVYVSNTGAVFDGPLNLFNITSLTVKDGAVVDGLVMINTGYYLTVPSITIEAGGVIQNSFIGAATIVNNGTSLNNTYLNPTYTGASGSISQGDYMLQGGVMQLAVDISDADSELSMVMNATSTITLNGTASFDSYAGMAPYNANSSNYTLTVTSSGTATVGCFLAGTLINTVNGLVAVENINVGDQIIAVVDGKEEIRSVIWVGQNTVAVNTDASKDEANYPIRILKNAISDGVPFKDLLVTPEHCIVLDGQFIPARMLVNNGSIFYDTSITEYTYYHIETEQHSIITADGVLTESYLDTGNRSGFISDENIVSIVNHHKEWNVDSAAPLTTNRDVVEPIFTRLIQRFSQLGFELCESNAVTTHESNLHLLTDTGEIIHSTNKNNGRFFFPIPEDTTHVQLISRSSRPSQAIGPYIDDRRDLGVLVGKVTLLEKHTAYSITEHFTSETLQGWDVKEPMNCRWTNGDGALNIRLEPSNNVAVLVIEVLNAGPYLLKESSLEQKVA
ncbi:hypothetical protein CIN_02140 [Commensalibacter intestini A911]|uniref:Hedgehog/Intein (Hint) domain-containing protein n=2 Tax=Commensalibacter intestini TaxID=479936 RepID=A0A251ZUJ7_9PROT|nr:Hint domain-containing protein [Commensalibacter intestini]EHD14282.1 hypothetical protein CIN_02140 [Commensalibacter intestini A911]OUI78327.1 hypothetical protein HK18_09845 [Commensalibacter intestini]